MIVIRHPHKEEHLLLLDVMSGDSITLSIEAAHILKEWIEANDELHILQ